MGDNCFLFGITAVELSSLLNTEPKLLKSYLSEAPLFAFNPAATLLSCLFNLSINRINNTGLESSFFPVNFNSFKSVSLLIFSFTFDSFSNIGKVYSIS